MFRTLTAVAALLALSSAAYAQTTTTETEVEQEAEEAATEVENAAEDAAAATEEAAEDAAAATEEAAEDAAAATEEAVEGAAAATEEAVDETEEAVDEAAAETEEAVDEATTETETVEIQPVEEDAEAVETETAEATDAETMSQGAPFANVTLEYGQNYLATTLIGQRIYAIDDDVEQDAVFPAGTQADWDDIGEIGDMVIGVDGTLEAVVIDVGGFLGIGEREVAIQWDAIRGVREDDDENEYFLAVTMPEEAMENAPELEREPAVSE